MDRRRFLKMSGSIGIAGLTGCMSGPQLSGQNTETTQKNQQNNPDTCREQDNKIPSFVVEDIWNTHYVFPDETTTVYIEVSNEGRGDGCFSTSVSFDFSTTSSYVAAEKRLGGHLDPGETKTFSVSHSFEDPGTYKNRVHYGDLVDQTLNEVHSHVLAEPMSLGDYIELGGFRFTVSDYRFFDSFDAQVYTGDVVTYHPPEGYRYFGLYIEAENRNPKPVVPPSQFHVFSMDKRKAYSRSTGRIDSREGYSGPYISDIQDINLYDESKYGSMESIHGGSTKTGWLLYVLNKDVSVNDLSAMYVPYLWEL